VKAASPDPSDEDNKYTFIVPVVSAGEEVLTTRSPA